MERVIASLDKEIFTRLDLLLGDEWNLSRNELKNHFISGHISSNIPLKLNKIPPVGTKIMFTAPAPRPSELIAENIPLEILFEDEHLLFVNKPSGMVVHPAPGHYSGTLVHALLFHVKGLKGIGQVERPGIVHRLDKGTTGVMVVAKTQECHQKLTEIFSKHDLVRTYRALVWGRVTRNGKLESLIGRHPQHRKKMSTKCRHGKLAKTTYSVLSSYSQTTEMSFTLHTGRTHQIRVHASELLRSPILGDSLYGRFNQQCQKIPNLPERPLLHAQILSLVHPITGKNCHFDVPAPQDYLTIRESFDV